MRFSNIIYFCDCYLIMVDYEEELVEIIGDFTKRKLMKNNTVKNEYEEILSLDNIMKVEETKNNNKLCRFRYRSR
ncbi:hypothetical protein [Clostridium septicum]|uniref:hypothetical protein n=1 Tax=Clostridium septicum TaxID=1504 RepID=UPI000FF8E500|nr:hypothetical protein [Clostridium septicum]QAS62114.1 hypothetical protein EI377_16045 [Clostridium septicum]